MQCIRYRVTSKSDINPFIPSISHIMSPFHSKGNTPSSKLQM